MIRLILVPLLLVACKGDGTTDSPKETGNVDDTSESVDTAPPEFTGIELYEINCASCHGIDGTGPENGPDDGPDLQQEVENHSDAQLIDFILNGKGDMEPVDVTEEEAVKIVDYLRNELF
jgi:mono/diheme cytochrome c family protein